MRLGVRGGGCILIYTKLLEYQNLASFMPNSAILERKKNSEIPLVLWNCILNPILEIMTTVAKQISFIKKYLLAQVCNIQACLGVLTFMTSSSIVSVHIYLPIDALCFGHDETVNSCIITV